MVANLVHSLSWPVMLSLSQKGIVNDFHELRQLQWLNHEQTLVHQRKQLEVLVRHSYQHVPYYQKILGELKIVTSDGKVNLTNWAEIPPLDRAALRQHFNELKSDDLSGRNWSIVSSGGSTGEPINAVHERQFTDWTNATMILQDIWCGHKMGVDTKLLLWGSERDLMVGHETTKTNFRRWIMNEVWLNAFKMTKDKMVGYVKQINSLKPNMIFAYAETIYELSKFIFNEGLQVYSPKAIRTGAGTLHSHMRETIIQAFKTNVFNLYGSREAPSIAQECESHKGLHITAPVYYIELLDKHNHPVQPGEIGEIVVTTLQNFAMPLVRYRIGDIGVWASEECDCGRAWPLLGEVTGRVADAFIRPDGSIVSPQYFIHIIGVVIHPDWLQKYQVVQESLGLIRVKIVSKRKAENPLAEFRLDLTTIEEKLQVVMGKDCQIEFEFLEEIEPTPSGKYRYTISNVNQIGPYGATRS
jgi:phenylacetate-CoA ligase